MPKHQRTRRLLRRLLATATALTLLTSLGTGTAHAGVMQFQDGFEVDPAAKWAIFGSHSPAGGFNINMPANARSGNNSGWLGAQPGGWSVQQIEVRTGSVSGMPETNCAAAVWIQPLVIRQEVAIEIWDLFGTMLYRKSAMYAGSQNYQQLYTDRWNLNGRTSVLVRTVDYGTTGQGGTIRLDDLLFQCYFNG
ncbi:hypothetical protein [Amycolatopsis sp. lyj-90]|uniref:hypothetical protein n=1 Tax=Amycolatopsis sp. lyj-90 TaxID=2789285 RepID=UPI0039799CC5